MKRLEEGETFGCEGDLVVKITDDVVPAITALKDVDGASAIIEGGWLTVGDRTVEDIEARDRVRHYLF